MRGATIMLLSTLAASVSLEKATPLLTERLEAERWKLGHKNVASLPAIHEQQPAGLQGAHTFVFVSHSAGSASSWGCGSDDGFMPGAVVDGAAAPGVTTLGAASIAGGGLGGAGAVSGGAS